MIIAIDAQGVFVDESDIFSTLFGSVAVEFLARDAELIDTRAIRQMTGFWTEGTLGRRSHVSAVLTGINIGPWNVARLEPVLWTNPWAERPLGFELPFRTIGIDLDGGARTEKPSSRTIADVLSLPPDWPGAGNAWDRIGAASEPSP